MAPGDAVRRLRPPGSPAWPDRSSHSRGRLTLRVESAGRRRTEASRLRALTGSPAPVALTVPLPVELDLVPWGRWRTWSPFARTGASDGAWAPTAARATSPRSCRHGRRGRRAVPARRRRGAAGLRTIAAMRALVVHAHPSPDSLSAALFATATDGAAPARPRGRARSTSTPNDFTPAMSAEERRAYHTDSPISLRQVARHAELVRWADALVFVYPTWWMGPPAALKGWLERVLVPGVAFHLDERTNKVVSDLRHVRTVVGISTYRSSWGASASCTTAAAASSSARFACCARGPAGRGGWRCTPPTTRPRPGGRPSSPGSSDAWSRAVRARR